MDKSLLDYILSQGLGVVFGAVVFWMYVKEKREHGKRLVQIIMERKTDRDELLRMLGRIDAHLTQADAFKEFARSAMQESLDPAQPKRRRTDKLLAQAFQYAPDDQDQA